MSDLQSTLRSHGEQKRCVTGLRNSLNSFFHGAACECNVDTYADFCNQSASRESLHSIVLILGSTPLWSIPSLQCVKVRIPLIPLSLTHIFLLFLTDFFFSFLHLPIKYLAFLCNDTALCSSPTTPSHHPAPMSSGSLTFPVQPHLFHYKLCW